MQKSHNLAVDGIAGEDTFAKIKKMLKKKDDKPVAKKKSVHAEAMKKASKKIGKDGKPILDGTRIGKPLTRCQLATVLDRLGMLD